MLQTVQDSQAKILRNMLAVIFSFNKSPIN